jgi:phage I-like protein
VDWTPAGAKMVLDKEYRGVSPALAIDRASGRVAGVLRASLTNLPNFDMATLHHQQETGMDLDRLRAGLGLPATASFEDCMAAVAHATQAVSTHAADIARLARAAGAAENAGITDIETVLAAARPAASEAQRMAQEIVSLNTQLAALTQDAARERATTVIDAAIKAGKPITAIRDHYISRHMQSPQDVELELKAIPSLHAGGVPRRPAQEGETAMSDQEIEVARRMGLTPEQIKLVRETREAQRGVH